MYINAMHKEGREQIPIKNDQNKPSKVISKPFTFVKDFRKSFSYQPVLCHLRFGKSINAFCSQVLYNYVGGKSFSPSSSVYAASKVCTRFYDRDKYFLNPSSRFEKKLHCPTDRFAIFKLQNPSHNVFELHKIRWSPDLEALKVRKDRSGESITRGLSDFLSWHRISSISTICVVGTHHFKIENAFHESGYISSTNTLSWLQKGWLAKCTLKFFGRKTLLFSS